MNNEILALGSAQVKEWFSVGEAAAVFKITRNGYRKLLKNHTKLLKEYLKELPAGGPTGKTTWINKDGLVILANLKNVYHGNKHEFANEEDSSLLQKKKSIAKQALAVNKPKFSLGEPLGLGFMPLPTVQLKEISKRSAIWSIISQLVNDPNDGKEYKVWYGRIYKQLLARYGVNIELKARNRNVKAIDQVEAEGLIEEAYAIAYKFLSDSQTKISTYRSPYEE